MTASFLSGSYNEIQWENDKGMNTFATHCRSHINPDNGRHPLLAKSSGLGLLPCPKKLVNILRALFNYFEYTDINLCQLNFHQMSVLLNAQNSMWIS